jgi:hypothetical protein
LVNTVDKQQAADTFVSLLIDFDEHVDDIRQAFKGDDLIKQALLFHTDQDQDDDEDELYEDDENDNYNE